MDLTSSTIDKTKSDLGLIADVRGLEKIRSLGAGDKKSQAQALYMAAQQFESLLMQYWVDGMRQTNDALNPDSPLKSKYSGFFDDMLAQQQVGAMVRGNSSDITHINKSSISYLITKQFARTLGDEGKELLAQLEGRTLENAPTKEVGSLQNEQTRFFELRSDDPRVHAAPKSSQLLAQMRSKNKAESTVSNLSSMYASLPSQEEMRNFSSPEDFVEKMMPYAVKAVEGIAMNPLVLVAQAALETGWGKHVPKNNNYYGIKAGSSWNGPTQDLDSPEFEGGKMVSRNSRFRAYPSVLESMKDYVSLITGNERYAKAANKSFDPDRYFDEIQKAGYATDPYYSAKLKNISRQIAFMAYK